MNKPKGNRLAVLLVCVSAVFCLLPIGQAHAQILPSPPTLAQRINVAPYAGVLWTNSQGVENGQFALGFTAEATLFTNTDCTFCPKELGAGTAYLTTGARVQVQDLVWLAAYWFWTPAPETTPETAPKTASKTASKTYVGIQGGYTTFTASAKDAADENKTVVLEAQGVRVGLTLGYQLHSNWYIEAAVAGRYFPVPKAVTAPLSSNPFGAVSAGINIGATFGETYTEMTDRKAKEKEQAKTEIDRWAEEKEHRRLQREHWAKEDEERKRVEEMERRRLQQEP